MVKLDPTIQTLTFAGIIAIAISVLVNGTLTSHGQDQTPSAAAATDAGLAAKVIKPVWAASATGRVEPKEGEVRIVAQSPGRIVDVLTKANEKVVAGDLLVRLDDEDLWAKLAAAKAEEAVRMRERDEEPAKGSAEDRRKGEDAVAAAERGVFTARDALDQVAAKVRAGSGTVEDTAAARSKLTEAKSKLSGERSALEKVNTKEDMPLPTRLESAMIIARSDVTQVENAIERARVRAPLDGTVLNVWAKTGELAVTSPEAPLVLFGDISGLRVRTEVEERDVVKVRIGQKVIVRADAFPDKDFEGVVTSLAPALGPPRILSRGPRRPNDVEVLEVMVGLDGQPSLLTGMRVDVFFKHESPAT